MANHRKENVIFVDTTADFTGIYHIESIKYIGNTSGTAVVNLDTNADAKAVWQASGANDLSADEVCIKAQKGFGVTLTNGAKIYIYLK